MKLVYIGGCVLGWTAFIAAALFIFGPGLVGAFDLSCWFMLDRYCTGIEWTEGRKMWAWMPWAFGAAVAFFGLIA